MSDDKSKIGSPDRDRVAGGEDYEVRYLADKHGISPDQARSLIAAHGNNRDEIEKAIKGR